MQPSMWRAVLLVGLLGCADRAPARLEIPADTLVLNTTLWSPMELRVVNRRGEAVPLSIRAFDGEGREFVDARLPLTIEDTTVVQLRHGWVKGLRPGGSSISTASAGRSGAMIVSVVAPDTAEERCANAQGIGQPARAGQRTKRCG